jgi:DNA-binding NtrC family response regulator
MPKSWFELFGARANQLPDKIHEDIFNVDDEGNLKFIIPNKQNEIMFNKAVVHFFVEHFYMKERVHLKEFMNSLERAILIKILTKFNGNQRCTAEFLGLNHTTLNQKIKKHNIRFRKTAISG